MEENRPGGFGDAQEARVDYSVGAGAREEIRRQREENRTCEYSQQNSWRKPEGIDIEFTSPNNDAGYKYEGGDKSFNNDVRNQQNYSYTSYNYGASSGGNVPPEPPYEKPYGVKRKPRVKKERKERNGSGNGKRILSIVLVVALCFAAGFGGGALAVKTIGSGSIGEIHNIKIDASDAQSLNASAVIAKKAMPSVVGISTVSQKYTQGVFGLQQGTVKGIGTGIIVSADGYIITNSHVVNGGDSSITVDLYNGNEYKGDVLWSDEALDLAIVKIDAKGLVAAELGDSDKVEIGDYAVAIGNPLGLEFERSVSQGIISGLNRTITTTDGTSTNTMDDLIQTDAAINSGNSGGPLLDSTGCVIGINTAKASSGEGMGFAIPINTVIPIIEEIKAEGTYEQPYIGITGYDLADIIQSYQTDFKAKEGVYVAQIYTNSPAAKAGIVEGDIITSLGGKTVTDLTSLKKALVSYRPGDQVTITVERNKTQTQIQITLGKSSEINQGVLQSNQSNGNSYGGSSNGNGSNGGGYYYGGGNGSQYYGGLENLYGGLFGN